MPLDLEKRLKSRSLRARGLLNPFVLPRIDRPQVRNRYLAAIERARGPAGPRVIPVLGGAGLGKSTLLGALWDSESERGPASLITCSEVSLPAEPTPASVDLAFGQALEVDVPLTEACRVAANGQGWLLLIDTLDLLLTRATVVPIRNFFHNLLAEGVTVLFTCRDFEYDRYFAAYRQQLPELDRSVDGVFVPPFTMDEVEEATRRFAEPTRGRVAAAHFARSVLDLAADRRPIREIVQNPLLLAMLCNLYSNVPPDLTVAQLYDAFWRSHVAVVRKADMSNAVGPRKERICVAIASRILDASIDHFVETIPAGDLRNETEDDIGVAAMTELQSEEIVRERLSRVAFFHQTFAEFVIARLLTESSQAGRLERILEALRSSGEAEHLHLWPVIRQLLVLADAHRFHTIVHSMPSLHLAAFRAIAAAAATRRDAWDLLSQLVDLAIAAGSEFQAAFVLALEIGGVEMAEKAEPLLLKVLEHGDSRAAALAAKLLGDFAADDDSISLANILSAIDRRAGTNAEGFTRNELQAAMVDGLTSSLGGTDHSVSRLAQLRTLLSRLTTPAWERLMYAHANELVNIADAEALLVALRAKHLTKNLYKAAACLLDRVIQVDTRGTWDLRELISGTWGSGWEYARGHSVASLLKASPHRTLEVVQHMLTSNGTSVGTCHTALSAVGENVAARVASVLLSNWQAARRRISLTAAVVQSIAPELAEETRISFRELLTPFVSEQEQKPLIALAALASTLQDEVAVMSLVKDMRDAAAFNILPKIVRAFKSPLGITTLRMGLDRAEHASPRGAAENARVRLVNLLSEPERSRLLTQLSVNPRFPNRVRIATAALAVSIAPETSLAELVPIIARPQQSTRLHAVQAIARAVACGGRLAVAELETIAAYLRDERDSAVLQAFFELGSWWIRKNETVSDEVLRIFDIAYIPRLVQLNGGAQREAVVFLKWAASVCKSSTEAFRQVRAMVVEVFLRLDFQRFHDGESEGLEMFSHIARADPSFGATLVDAWEKGVAGGRPVASYTLRSLVHLLNRTRQLDLYKRMLLNSALPQGVRSMILQHLNV